MSLSLYTCVPTCTCVWISNIYRCTYKTSNIAWIIIHYIWLHEDANVKHEWEASQIVSTLLVLINISVGANQGLCSDKDGTIITSGFSRVKVEEYTLFLGPEVFVNVWTNDLTSFLDTDGDLTYMTLNLSAGGT